MSRSCSTVERATSVSSRRRMNVPPWRRANRMLNRAVRAVPMCSGPVGLGAIRQRMVMRASVPEAPRRAGASAASWIDQAPPAADHRSVKGREETRPSAPISPSSGVQMLHGVRTAEERPTDRLPPSVGSVERVRAGRVGRPDPSCRRAAFGGATPNPTWSSARVARGPDAVALALGPDPREVAAGQPDVLRPRHPCVPRLRSRPVCRDTERIRPSAGPPRPCGSGDAQRWTTPRHWTWRRCRRRRVPVPVCPGPVRPHLECRDRTASAAGRGPTEGRRCRRAGSSGRSRLSAGAGRWAATTRHAIGPEVLPPRHATRRPCRAASGRIPVAGRHARWRSPRCAGGRPPPEAPRGLVAGFGAEYGFAGRTGG